MLTCASLERQSRVFACFSGIAPPLRNAQTAVFVAVFVALPGVHHRPMPRWPFRLQSIKLPGAFAGSLNRGKLGCFRIGPNLWRDMPTLWLLIAIAINDENANHTVPPNKVRPQF